MLLGPLYIFFFWFMEWFQSSMATTPPALPVPATLSYPFHIFHLAICCQAIFTKFSSWDLGGPSRVQRDPFGRRDGLDNIERSRSSPLFGLIRGAIPETARWSSMVKSFVQLLEGQSPTWQGSKGNHIKLIMFLFMRKHNVHHCWSKQNTDLKLSVLQQLHNHFYLRINIHTHIYIYYI